RRPIGALVALALAVALAGCGSSRSREEREARINVYPDNYRADLQAALHAYVIDPTNIRDAFVSDPAIKPLGTQNRYVACLRYNAKNSDGRYTGSKDVLAIFVSGRFDQFVDLQLNPANSSSQATAMKELCAQADYKRFPELEAMTR
ncbi:MAG: hypothetical protein ACHQIO_17250, partial [Nevskiales bacterium]